MAGRRGRPRGSGKGKSTTTAPPEQHAGAVDTQTSNIGNREKEMRAAFKALYSIDNEIAAVIEEHVKPLRADKSGIVDSLRERFGLTSKYFKANYKLYQLTEDATRAKDDVSLDALRELFAIVAERFGADIELPARPVRSTSEQEIEEPVQGAAAETHDPEQAWSEGEAAGKRNAGLAACPYSLPHQHKLKARWEEGYEAGETEVARAMGQPAPERPQA